MSVRVTKTKQDPCKSELRFAGIHLSGPNAKRTALAIATGNILTTPLKLKGLYEKIGSMGKVFSDDYLLELISTQGPFSQLMVDCPLSVPPCVACTRKTCPGVHGCDDVGVAYILALTARLPKKHSRKRRPINPQSQRVWDVQQLLKHSNEHFEPTYSANLAPLVARAATIQKRLLAIDPRSKIHETVPHLALEAIGASLNISEKLTANYRNFENGRYARAQIFEILQNQAWLANDTQTNQILARASGSTESFHAVVCAILACMLQNGLCDEPPETYSPELGWVHLPAVESDMLSEPATSKLN